MRNLTLGLLLIFASCSKGNKNQTLNIDEYLKLGVPEINKVWRASDYEELAVVLHDLKKKDFRSLPTSDSETSGAVFARIISTENIDTLFHDQKNGKADLKDFFSSYQKVLALYQDGDNNDFYHKEVADLLIFIIKLSDETYSNMEKLPNLDTSSNLVVEQKVKIRNGYKNMIIGALEMQQIVRGFTEDDLLRFSMAVVESLDKNKNRLNEETINEIEQKVESLLDTTESNTLKANYTRWLNDNRNGICQSQVDTLTNLRVFNVVDEAPTSEGGLETLAGEVQKRIVYPADSKYTDNTKVIIAFVIMEDGQILGKRIIKNVGTVGEQFLDVVDDLRWEPGLCKGEKVKTLFVLPMAFDIK